MITATVRKKENMSDTTLSMRNNQPCVPLIDKRQGMSSSHGICIDLHALPKKETPSPNPPPI